MEKRFNFGKIAYKGGRKINAVDVDVCYGEEDGHKTFAASARVWNMTHTDIIVGGQCLDDIAEFVKDEKFNEILRLWKLYHLNDMHPGTREQEEALEEAVKEGKLENRYASNYTNCCEYLKSIGLYEVEHEGKPYRFGTGWLIWDIPEADIKKIEELLAD